MKFRVNMKTPDAVCHALNEEVRPGLPDDLDDGQKDAAVERAGEITGRWFRRGEYLTVEIDTDAMTCVVVPRGG